MDLLFKRYASPFILLDGFIITSSLNNFIDDFLGFINETREWEFFFFILLSNIIGQLVLIVDFAEKSFFVIMLFFLISHWPSKNLLLIAGLISFIYC